MKPSELYLMARTRRGLSLRSQFSQSMPVSPEATGETSSLPIFRENIHSVMKQLENLGLSSTIEKSDSVTMEKWYKQISTVRMPAPNDLSDLIDPRFKENIMLQMTIGVKHSAPHSPHEHLAAYTYKGIDILTQVTAMDRDCFERIDMQILEQFDPDNSILDWNEYDIKENHVRPFKSLSEAINGIESSLGVVEKYISHEYRL